MTGYLLQRLFHALTILIGISLLIFGFVELAPGDAVDAMLPPESFANADAKERMREQLGLNEPAPLRYLHWLGRTATGDLGYSLTSRKPITEVIFARLPTTLQLVGFALVISVIIGITTGIVAAIKQYSWIDYLTTFFSFFWLSIPGFFLGLLMIYLFAVRLNWFPAFGSTTAGATNPVWDRLHHLVLPSLTLSILFIPLLTRLMRSTLLEVMAQDYVRTARAKGLRERSVIWRHGLRNALIPVITVIGLQFGALLGGAVITEAVFAWPGVGSLSVQALFNRDYPIVQTTVMLLAVVFALINLAVDISYGFLDPRIRYS